MQSFMAVPVDAITCTHGLSHRAQGLARNGCVVSDEAATQERCGAYLGRCSPWPLVEEGPLGSDEPDHLHGVLGDHFALWTSLSGCCPPVMT